VKKAHLIAVLVLLSMAGMLWVLWEVEYAADLKEQDHFDRGETEVIVSNEPNDRLDLFKAGRHQDDAMMISDFKGERIWLPKGNYFLSIISPSETLYVPIPLTGYRSGPDDDGSFLITIRPRLPEMPPRLLQRLPPCALIPSGSFLIGDRLNPREPHYVWLTGFFISPFEVTNAEFKKFFDTVDGYRDDSNWTEEGRRWKANNRSNATALLTSGGALYKRFGRPDQPVTWVNWYEANAFCNWLTKTLGQSKWQFALPSEAEWEKAARGPDSFDYALGASISDDELNWYNWKKNPNAAVAVVGINESQTAFKPNRYGLYHMSGNVVEWTQSLLRPFNREHPYTDDDRNHGDVVGLRVARGGSWYSASTALLYLPYRDAFQPEHSSQDIGFRIVARRLP
jgi:formylglycine-generating enzyme required for sulfatase activity